MTTTATASRLQFASVRATPINELYLCQNPRVVAYREDAGRFFFSFDCGAYHLCGDVEPPAGFDFERCGRLFGLDGDC